MRRDVQDAQITTFPGDNDRPVLFSTMKPWPDVKVSTWLVPPPAEEDGEQEGSPNWHLRIHKIESGRDLVSAEGGFAIKGTNSWNGRVLTSAFDEEHQEGTLETPVSAAVVSRAGVSGVRDLSPVQRDGQVLHADANSNLVEARWFGAGVFGLPAGVGSDAWKGEWRKQWEAGVKVPGWVEEMVKGEKE
jgi:hypothetical protein